LALVDAKISFPSGLTVSWAGKPIGSIKMNDVDVVGDVGANIDLESAFEVADIEHITQFTKVRGNNFKYRSSTCLTTFLRLC
jgi:hypothetical protein